MALSLLALGGYLIEQQFVDPIQAQSVGLLLAALLISTAATFFYCLLHSSRKLRRHIGAWTVPELWEANPTVVARATRAIRIEESATEPPHGRYVDRTLILTPR